MQLYLLVHAFEGVHEDCAQHLDVAAGVAVTMDMLTTTGLVTLVMIMVWQLHVALALCFLLFFGTIELAFFSSTLLKVPHGGW